MSRLSGNPNYCVWFDANKNADVNDVKNADVKNADVKNHPSNLYL